MKPEDLPQAPPASSCDQAGISNGSPRVQRFLRWFGSLGHDDVGHLLDQPPLSPRAARAYKAFSIALMVLLAIAMALRLIVALKSHIA